MISEKKAVSVTEVARILDIGRNLAYEAVARGEIPSIRIGGRILVPVAALEKLLNPQVVDQAKEETEAAQSGRIGGV